MKPLLGLVFAGIVSGCEPAKPVEQAESPRSAASGETFGFVHPELLVETDWLAEGGPRDNLRIVDTRAAEEYASGHIPGAVSIPRSATFDPNGARGMVGRPEQIAKLFGEKGIDETHHVVVYDEGRSTAAPRVFWTLELYGHPNVSVLNGGFPKWVAESRDVATDAPATAPSTFTAVRAEGRLSTQEGILEDLGASSTMVVDSRTSEEFSGETVRSERGGHIPEAVHIEWTRNFTEGDASVFKSAAELAAIYANAGVTRDKRVHAY